MYFYFYYSLIIYSSKNFYFIHTFIINTILFNFYYTITLSKNFDIFSILEQQLWIKMLLFPLDPLAKWIVKEK